MLKSKFRWAIVALIIVVILLVGTFMLNVGDINHKNSSSSLPTDTATITKTPLTTNNSQITPAESIQENGICYSPFRDGQSPDAGIFPTTEQITEDLTALKEITGSIRTYSSTNGLESIPAIAKQLGLKVYQGVYLNNNTEQNEAEIKNAISLANQNLVDSIIVGNEILLTNTLNESSLIKYIQEVKQNVPANVSVTAAEPWNVWLDHPNLAKAVDYLLIHVHPFWENQTIETAANYVINCYNKVSGNYSNKQVIIGETGWPSAGNATWTGVSNNTILSEANEKKFIQDFTVLAHQNSIKYFYFDAFDEEFKWQEGAKPGVNSPLDRTYAGEMPGSSWGIFQSNGEIKPQLTSLFNGTNAESRKVRIIFNDGQLSAGYSMGVDSSEHLTNWVNNDTGDGSVRMDYPEGQSWGAVFISVGQLTNSSKPFKDFSQLHTLSLTVRGAVGNEQFYVGLKDANASNDPVETRYLISNTTTLWQTYTYTIDSFSPINSSILNIPLEFVFSGSTPQTLYFRNIEFLP